MELILIKDVDKLGKAGEAVEVADGFGRNYLIPYKLALQATVGNKRALERQKQTEEVKEARRKEEAGKLARRLQALSVTVTKKAGPDDKLFGALTAADVADALGEENIDIDRKDIELPEEIKKLGVYTVTVKLYSGITGSLKVWVVK